LLGLRRGGGRRGRVRGLLAGRVGRSLVIRGLRSGRIRTVLLAFVVEPGPLPGAGREQRSPTGCASGRYPHFGYVDERGLVGAGLTGVERAALADRRDPIAGHPIDSGAFAIAIPVAIRPCGRRLGLEGLQRGTLIEVG